MKKQVRLFESAISRLSQPIGAEVKTLTVREPTRPYKIDSPESVVEYWTRHVRRAPWYDPGREMVVVLCCDTRYQVIAFALVSLGTLNESAAHPRDVFRPAIALNAFAVVLMHNHPSGVSDPSKSDKALTNQIRQAGELLQIKLLDHLIVGSEKSFSFNCGRVAMRARARKTAGSARVGEAPARQLYLAIATRRTRKARPRFRELMKLRELLQLQTRGSRDRAQGK